MTSPRATYLEAVADCLRRILRANGYNTDAGALVTLEPEPVAPDEEKKPFVTVVWSRQRRPAEVAVARTHRATDLSIIAKLPADYARAQEQLDLMVQDIERALADQQYRFPTGYQFPQYQSAEPIPSLVGGGWAGVVINVTGNIPTH